MDLLVHSWILRRIYLQTSYNHPIDAQCTVIFLYQKATSYVNYETLEIDSYLKQFLTVKTIWFHSRFLVHGRKEKPNGLGLHAIAGK